VAAKSNVAAHPTAAELRSITIKINKTVGIIEKHLLAPHTTRAGGADRDGHPGRVKAIKTNSILSYLELSSFKVDTIPINITRYSP
jgi:hypothetical protein